MPKEEKEPTFEEMLSELEAIVSAVEEGKIGLEESIDQYEKGMKLIQRCRQVLTNAEARIQKLQVAENGTISTTPMEEPKEE
ncbi:MAG: exodeoxyribonuclease VII small subunit [Planctomycetota bacterium]|jgi:exodeoxyribonuclease VII small subunit